MRKSERKPPLRHIREIIFTDGITLEVFRYPLNENGSHIKKMSRAKRTNYSGRKRKVGTIEKGEIEEASETTDNYENIQTEESSSPILEIEEKQTYPFEINFNDQLQLPQISIDDTEPIQLSIDPEIIKSNQTIDLENIPIFNNCILQNPIEIDFTIDKIDTISLNSHNDFNYLKLF